MINNKLLFIDGTDKAINLSTLDKYDKLFLLASITYPKVNQFVFKSVDDNGTSTYFDVTINDKGAMTFVPISLKESDIKKEIVDDLTLTSFRYGYFVRNLFYSFTKVDVLDKVIIETLTNSLSECFLLHGQITPFSLAKIGTINDLVSLFGKDNPLNNNYIKLGNGLDQTLEKESHSKMDELIECLLFRKEIKINLNIFNEIKEKFNSIKEKDVQGRA